ncbi:MAG: hypothetical protein LBM02_00730 [Lachnospiraceae bacterium]|jgi:hypothetical protein|nr:hypothetical protein [Lachnospiraceae bacterium]
MADEFDNNVNQNGDNQGVDLNKDTSDSIGGQPIGNVNTQEDPFAGYEDPNANYSSAKQDSFSNAYANNSSSNNGFNNNASNSNYNNGFNNNTDNNGFNNNAGNNSFNNGANNGYDYGSGANNNGTPQGTTIYLDPKDAELDPSPMSMGEWILTIIACNIPFCFIGLIFCIVWSVSKKGNLNRRNFARANLIITIVLTIIFIIFYAVVLAAMIPTLQKEGFKF